MDGRIKSFNFQKITSQLAKKLRDQKFGRQFIGLALKDFDAYDPATGKGSGKAAELRNPVPEVEDDFRSSLRALKKNLVLMDEFVYSTERGKP